jgi:DNA-binding NarL/FixJ family response regulator
VRIVLAEDSALVREGLVRLLGDAGEDVVAAVADGNALVEAAIEHRPDLAIVDVRMPPTYTDEGARAATRLRAEIPGLAVLILSQDIEPALLEISRGAGGFGYLLKDRVLDVSAFMSTVRRVALGGRAVDPEVVAALVSAEEHVATLEELSGREREILGLMAEGLTNAGIARRLVLGERTVETHVSSILLKLGITTTPDDHRRVQAVIAYLRAAR